MDERPLWDRSVEDVCRGPIHMMLLDLDYTIDDEGSAVLRFFGCTPGGTSVTAFVKGFDPYFYACKESPFDFKAPTDSVPPLTTLCVLRCYQAVNDGEDASCLAGLRDVPDHIRDLVTAPAIPLCENLRTQLNEDLSRTESREKRRRFTGSVVKKIELVLDRVSFYGYNRKATAFFRVTLGEPPAVPRVRKLIESGHFEGISTTTYESNVPFGIRAMIDMRVVGCGWLELPAGSYRHVVLEQRRARTGWELEVADWRTMIAHQPSDAPEWSRIAPILTLSFDIECKGRPGKFPRAEQDPVIQIANYVHRMGDPPDRFLEANVFNLRGCLPIPGADVYTFDDERTLLLTWARFFRSADPDVVTGYNTARFDIRYLLERAKALGIGDEFSELGRLLGVQALLKSWSFSSKAYGASRILRAKFHGRVQTDAYELVERNEKLRSYTLNNVSAALLGERKEDVHYTEISGLHMGSDKDRHRLAVYCLKDALLPLRIIWKKMYDIRYIEMSRVTGVPWETLLTRGQQIKVMTQLLLTNFRSSNGFLIPALNRKGKSYEGAVVLDPSKGFYQKPIATIDFASLYPSIIQANNLCYTTLIPAEVAETMDPADHRCTPSGFYFVRAHVRKGVLPAVLESLLAARSCAKKEKAAAEKEAAEVDAQLEKLRLELEARSAWNRVDDDDAERRALVIKSLKLWNKVKALEGRQLALKLSANSVYGFTGVKSGKLPCQEIADSVTAFGRLMIALTKAVVQACRLFVRGVDPDGTAKTIREGILAGTLDPRKLSDQDLRRASAYGPVVVPPSTWTHGQMDLAGDDIQAAVDVLLAEQQQDFTVIYGDTGRTNFFSFSFF